MRLGKLEIKVFHVNFSSPSDDDDDSALKMNLFRGIEAARFCSHEENI